MFSEEQVDELFPEPKKLKVTITYETNWYPYNDAAERCKAWIEQDILPELRYAHYPSIIVTVEEVKDGNG